MRLLPVTDTAQNFEPLLKMQNDYRLEQGLAELTSVDLKKHFTAIQADKDIEFFLIEADNQIVGFSEVQLEEECFPDEDLPEVCLKVTSFYIRPEYRNKMLGHHAFKLVKQWGHDKKASLVEIEADPKLDISNHFLQDVGLELVGSGAHNVWRGFI